MYSFCLFVCFPSPWQPCLKTGNNRTPVNTVIPPRSHLVSASPSLKSVHNHKRNQTHKQTIPRLFIDTHRVTKDVLTFSISSVNIHTKTVFLYLLINISRLMSSLFFFSLEIGLPWAFTSHNTALLLFGHGGGDSCPATDETDKHPLPVKSGDPSATHLIRRQQASAQTQT